MIELKNLRCVKQYLPPDSQNRSLDELELYDHIHGSLILQPDGAEPLYHFGYFGENDACIGEWLVVLIRMRDRFELGGDFTFEYPFPDQGDPQVEYIFSEHVVTVRTTCYDDDRWTNVTARNEQTTDRKCFEKCVCDAIDLIESTVLKANPKAGATWLDRQKMSPSDLHKPRGAGCLFFWWKSRSSNGRAVN